MPIKAVIFDLFDTLLMLEKHEAYYSPSLKKLCDYLDKNGVGVHFGDFERVYFEVRNRLYEESSRNLEEPHFDVRVSQTLQRLGHNFDVTDPVVKGATMAFADEFMHHVSLDPDVMEVLSELRGKYKLGLISNFGIPECARKLLEKFGLTGFFDVVIISGEINRRKPSPEIFRKALKILDVKASKSVFVGDMLDLDVVGPKNVGMKSILVKRRPIAKCANAEPDRQISSLAELLTVLEDF